VCSASYKGACTGQEVLDVADGKAQLASLFSREQRSFSEDHAPAQIKLDALVPLGPTFLLRVKRYPTDFYHRIIVELGLYPDGSRVFEISTKCTPDQAFQAAWNSGLHGLVRHPAGRRPEDENERRARVFQEGYYCAPAG
jgi:hypothetical protein